MTEKQKPQAVVRAVTDVGLDVYALIVTGVVGTVAVGKDGEVQIRMLIDDKEHAMRIADAINNERLQ